MNEHNVVNFDPNLVLNGKLVDYKIKLVFGSWEHRHEAVVTVGGNCKGLTIIESAVASYYETLPEDDYGDGVKYLQLGNHLCHDDDEMQEDWLADMLVSAEIISITPRPKVKAMGLR